MCNTDTINLSTAATAQTDDSIAPEQQVFDDQQSDATQQSDAPTQISVLLAKYPDLAEYAKYFNDTDMTLTDQNTDEGKQFYEKSLQKIIKCRDSVAGTAIISILSNAMIKIAIGTLSITALLDLCAAAKLSAARSPEKTNNLIHQGLSAGAYYINFCGGAKGYKMHLDLPRKEEKKEKKKENKSDPDYEQSMLNALQKHGFILETLGPPEIFNRCPTENAPQSLNGAYIYHAKSYSCFYRDFAIDDKFLVCHAKKISDELKYEVKELFEEKIKEIQKQQEEIWGRRAIYARSVYESAKDIEYQSDHQYLVKKKIPIPKKEKTIPPPKITYDEITNDEGKISIARGKKLVIPLLYCDDGEYVISSLLFIFEDGQKRFLPGGRTKDRFYIITGETAEVIAIAEGYATGVSVHEATGLTTIVSFSAYNLLSVSRYFLEALDYKSEIIFAADWDCPNIIQQNKGGHGYAAARNAITILATEAQLKNKTAQLSLALPVAHKNSDEKVDFNDLYVDGKESKISEYFDNRKSFTWLSCLHLDTDLEFSFEVYKNKEALWLITYDEKLKKKYTCVAPPFSIEARGDSTVDGHVSSTGTILRWETQKNVEMTDIVFDRDLANRDSLWFGKLRGEGLKIKCENKGLFVQFLDSVQTTRLATFVNTTGFHLITDTATDKLHNIFVLPNEIIGSSGNEYVLFTEVGKRNPYLIQGTLEEWQTNIAKYCAGNSILMMGLMIALSGPLLQLTTIGSGGLNLVGATSQGKSVCAKVAATIWGRGCQNEDGLRGFINSWRATLNGLEGLAAAHNGTCLFLDELGNADKKAVETAAYTLSSGLGKTKMNRQSELKEELRWCLSIFSTAEITVGDKIREDGGTPHAGQGVRIIDFSADAGKNMGILEDLHEFVNPKEFIKHMEEASIRYYGNASREFLQNIIDNYSAIKSNISDELKNISEKLLSSDESSSAMSRIVYRIALYVYAGIKAIEWKIFPESITIDMLYTAAKSVIASIIMLRGGTQSPEEIDINEALMRGISKNNHLFVNIDVYEQELEKAEMDDKARYPQEKELYGFKKEMPDGMKYYLIPERFGDIFRGLTKKIVLDTLRKSKILQSDSDRGTAKAPSNFPQPWSRKRMYVFYIPNGDNDGGGAKEIDSSNTNINSDDLLIKNEGCSQNTIEENKHQEKYRQAAKEIKNRLLSFGITVCPTRVLVDDGTQITL